MALVDGAGQQGRGFGRVVWGAGKGRKKGGLWKAGVFGLFLAIWQGNE